MSDRATPDDDEEFVETALTDFGGPPPRTRLRQLEKRVVDNERDVDAAIEQLSTLIEQMTKLTETLEAEHDDVPATDEAAVEAPIEWDMHLDRSPDDSHYQ